MMKLQVKIAVITGALALTAAPAFAAQPDGVPPQGKGQGNGPVYTPGDPTPGPKAGLPAQAKAYGRYCKGKSKKHVKGEPGTEFSRCVKAMAKAANLDADGDRVNPSKACRGLSKKHVKGEPGTEFSRCVKAAARLQNDQDEEGVS
jgi:hypothetical protein